MSLLERALRSSIGRKQLVAVTGLALSVFLVTHLAGNLLLFLGPETFDAYAEVIERNPLLVPAEIVLLAVFLVHIGLALACNYESRRARARGYVVKGSRGASNIASRNMVLSGLVVLVFVPIHVINVKFAARVPLVAPSGEETESLYWVVIQFFQGNLLGVSWYVFAVVVLGFHVGHGLQSSVKTLGFRHARYTRAVGYLSIAFGVVVAVGYSVLPVYAYFHKELGQ
jgi:succinate dehydrogenase / fumarate reductase cytochrome b subunit